MGHKVFEKSQQSVEQNLMFMAANSRTSYAVE